MNTSSAWGRKAVRGVLPLVLVALLAFPSVGCVDFEKETVCVAFPRGRDEVHLLLVYEGIHVAGNEPRDLDAAKEQITKFVNSDEEFCLADNWITHFVLTPGNDGGDDLWTKLKPLARKHIVVHNEAFFRNKAGRLCGYQTVTIKKASQFVAELNRLTSEFVGESLAEDTKNPEKSREWPDPASMELLRRAARDSYPWVRIEPGRFRFTLPCSPALLAHVKREIRQSKAKDEEPFLLALLLGETPWSFEQRKDRVVVSLGLGEGAPLIVPTHDQPHDWRQTDEEFERHALSLGKPFREDATTDGLIAEFVEHVETSGDERGWSLVLSGLVAALLQVLAFSLVPLFAYVVSQRRLRGFFHYIGLYRPEARTIPWIALIAIIAIHLVLAIFCVPEFRGVATTPETVAGRLRSFGLSAETAALLLVHAWVQTSLSEEIFFRGFLAKRLIAREGFSVGNLAQAALFGLVHFALFWILLGPAMTLGGAAVLLISSMVLGWLAGVLNVRLGNGSILPGWIVHAFSNTIACAVLAFAW